MKRKSNVDCSTKLQLERQAPADLINLSQVNRRTQSQNKTNRVQSDSTKSLAGSSSVNENSFVKSGHDQEGEEVKDKQEKQNERKGSSVREEKHEDKRRSRESEKSKHKQDQKQHQHQAKGYRMILDRFNYDVWFKNILEEFKRRGMVDVLNESNNKNNTINNDLAIEVITKHMRDEDVKLLSKSAPDEPETARDYLDRVHDIYYCQTKDMINAFWTIQLKPCQKISDYCNRFDSFVKILNHRGIKLPGYVKKCVLENGLDAETKRWLQCDLEAISYDNAIKNLRQWCGNSVPIKAPPRLSSARGSRDSLDESTSTSRDEEHEREDEDEIEVDVVVDDRQTSEGHGKVIDITKRVNKRNRLNESPCEGESVLMRDSDTLTPSIKTVNSSNSRTTKTQNCDSANHVKKVQSAKETESRQRESSSKQQNEPNYQLRTQQQQQLQFQHQSQLQQQSLPRPQTQPQQQSLPRPQSQQLSLPHPQIQQLSLPRPQSQPHSQELLKHLQHQQQLNYQPQQHYQIQQQQQLHNFHHQPQIQQMLYRSQQQHQTQQQHQQSLMYRPPNPPLTQSQAQIQVQPQQQIQYPAQQQQQQQQHHQHQAHLYYHHHQQQQQQQQVVAGPTQTTMEVQGSATASIEAAMREQTARRKPKVKTRMNQKTPEPSPGGHEYCFAAFVMPQQNDQVTASVNSTQCLTGLDLERQQILTTQKTSHLDDYDSFMKLPIRTSPTIPEKCRQAEAYRISNDIAHRRASYENWSNYDSNIQDYSNFRRTLTEPTNNNDDDNEVELLMEKKANEAESTQTAELSNKLSGCVQDTTTPKVIF